MRKFAREAVLCGLFGLVIGCGYFYVQEFTRYQDQSVEKASLEAEGEMYLPVRPRALFLKTLEGAALGFAAGFGLWSGFRLVRFAIKG